MRSAIRTRSACSCPGSKRARRRRRSADVARASRTTTSRTTRTANESASSSSARGWSAASGAFRHYFLNKILTDFLARHSILSYHFGCLPGLLQKEFTDVLKAEHEAAAAAQPSLVDPPPLALVDPLAPAVVPMPIPVPKRDKIELDMNRTFVVPKCWGCKKAGGRRCYECGVSGRKMEGAFFLSQPL